MNAKLLRNLLSGSILTVAAATVFPAHAAVDCNAPKGIAEQRACEAASRGVESLRRFTERTRNIYHVYVHDYDRAVAAGGMAKADEEIKVAEIRK